VLSPCGRSWPRVGRIVIVKPWHCRPRLAGVVRRSRARSLARSG
jgi:hypothetical protein